MLAEDLVGGCGRPVLKRRLFKVLDAVQSGRDPVAGDRHFPGNLGVTPFVWPVELVIVEIAEPDDSQHAGEQYQRTPFGLKRTWDDFRASGKPARRAKNDSSMSSGMGHGPQDVGENQD